MSAAAFVPFRALRFAAERVGDLGAVWAPPYDVIEEDETAALRRRHPNNIVWVDKPEGDARERYVRAAGVLRSWIAEGALAREREPVLYLHRHSFDVAGHRLDRIGLWGLVRLSEFGVGPVLPHEHTLGGPKADRLALMRETRAHLSPVFFISSDPGGRLRRTLAEQARGAAPLVQTEFPAGESHAIWRLAAESGAGVVARALAGQTLLIADGHHRYETALAYRDELAAAGAPRDGRNAHEFVLAYVVPEGDAGLVLWPTHRAVAGAPLDWHGAIERARERFDVRPLSAAEVARAETLLEEERGRPSLVLAARGATGGWLLRLREPDRLSVISSVAFHELFLGVAARLPSAEQVERMSYHRDVEEALGRVARGSAQAAALLSAPRVEQVREAAAAGARLPPKTTYFWPKVPTGIAIHVVDPAEEVTGER